ncbi:hypothetical protein ABPG74_013059 [Tetrahymena malaccensis]
MKLNYLLLLKISQLVLIIKCKSILNCKRQQIQQIENHNYKITLLCEECDDGYIQSADSQSCLAKAQNIEIRNLQTTYCVNGIYATSELCCNYCSNTGTDQCLSCNQACQSLACPNNLVCASTDIFSKALGQCLFYCGSGVLAYSPASCTTSQICQDGLQWSQQYLSCIYSGCQNHFVAKVGQDCKTSQLCQAGYQYHSSQKGDENSQGVCIKLSEQYQQYQEQNGQQIQISNSDSTQTNDNLFIGIVAFSFVFLAMIIIIIVYCHKKLYQNMNINYEKDGYDEVISHEEKKDDLENKQADSRKESNIEKGSTQNMMQKDIKPSIISRGVQDILLNKNNAQNITLDKADKQVQTDNLVKLQYYQFDQISQQNEGHDQNDQDEQLNENCINIELASN